MANTALDPKFGDRLRNTAAGESNPHRDAFFVRKVRKTGRMNPGLWFEMTDGKGEMWLTNPQWMVAQPAESAEAGAVPAGVLFRCIDDPDNARLHRYERIKAIFMAHGFKIKEGQTDLKTYVYEAADALLRDFGLAASPAAPAPDTPESRWPAKHYNARQRAWCARYLHQTTFDPLMDDYEAGNESFVSAAKKSAQWYEDHTNDAYLRITDGCIPGDEFDDAALAEKREGAEKP